MKLKHLMFLLLSHVGAGIVGFMLGIYLLPILIAPEAPSAAQVEKMSADALYRARFVLDLEGSYSCHW